MSGDGAVGGCATWTRRSAAGQSRQGPRAKGEIIITPAGRDDDHVYRAGKLAAWQNSCSDVDFRPDKPAEGPIAPADHVLKLAERKPGLPTVLTTAEMECPAVAERAPAIAFRDISAMRSSAGRRACRIERRLEAEAVEVAVASAAKLAPELVAREPVRLARYACHRVLQAAGRNAAVAVRVNDALSYRPRAARGDARALGFEGL